MRSYRPILLALLLVPGFYFLTTHNRLPFDIPVPGGEPHRASKLEITEAAAPQTFDSEEQNNIQVYKKVLPSVVNITSRAMAFNFFYGAVPEEGQGSGFVI